ncbi:SAM-dependent methyltransferase, partial [Devosia indica]
MKTILVVGIGTGSAEHVTVAAIEALNRADVLFIPDKGAGKSDLADVRRTIIARHVLRPDPRQIGYAVPRRDAQSADYGQGVADWHRSLADIYAMLISDVPENGTGAFLVWGDPGLYDSTLRILALVAEPIRVEVFPGITAVQALTAAHGIALNRIGEPGGLTPPPPPPPLHHPHLLFMVGGKAGLGGHPKQHQIKGGKRRTPPP